MTYTIKKYVLLGREMFLNFFKFLIWIHAKFFGLIAEGHNSRTKNSKMETFCSGNSIKKLITLSANIKAKIS